MKKLILWVSLLFGLTVFAKATEFTFGKTFSTDTRQVTLSTNPASMTQILSNDSYVYRTWIVNTSSVPIFISSFTSTNFTVSIETNTFFSIPGSSATTVNVASVMWSPDGPFVSYSGPMFANANPGGSAVSISVFRMK